VDGGQRAGQGQGRAQFFQGHVGLAAQERAHRLVMGREDERLASRTMVARGDVAGAAALLQELFDQTQGHAVAPGDLLSGAFLLVVGTQDALSQIQRDRAHEHRFTKALP